LHRRRHTNRVPEADPLRPPLPHRAGDSIQARSSPQLVTCVTSSSALGAGWNTHPRDEAHRVRQRPPTPRRPIPVREKRSLVEHHPLLELEIRHLRQLAQPPPHQERTITTQQNTGRGDSGAYLPPHAGAVGRRRAQPCALGACRDAARLTPGSRPAEEQETGSHGPVGCPSPACQGRVLDGLILASRLPTSLKTRMVEPFSGLSRKWSSGCHVRPSRGPDPGQPGGWIE
jgi:hypothetical protein